MVMKPHTFMKEMIGKTWSVKNKELKLKFLFK